MGGGVRDHLLQAPVKDWDLEVYGLDDESLVRVLRRLGPVNTVGRSFGVLKLAAGGLELDVALPRRDSKVGAGHRGIAVVGDPEMSLRAASSRRDLTINAMMVDVLTGELIDHHGGREDLQARVLRAVDADTFLEDPLRALRVVQFAARLEFEPDAELAALCRTAQLEELPAERIQAEWGKLLLRGKRPSLGLEFARKTAILHRLFPDIPDQRHADPMLDRLAAGPRDSLEGEGRRWAVMLATWLHDRPGDAIERTLDRLWLHRWHSYPLRDRVLAAVSECSTPVESDRALRWLSTRAEVELTLWVRFAVTQTDVAPLLTRARELGIEHAKPDPILQGRHLKKLGIKPGPAMGRVLAAVYSMQLDGDVTTLAEAKTAAAGPHA